MDFLPRNWKLVIAIASLSLVTLGISAWILKTAAPKHSDHAGTRNIPGFSLASEKTSKSAENIESIDNRTLDNESPTATPAENPAPSRVSDPVSGPWLASSPLQGVATLPDKTLPAIVSDDLQATLPSGAVGANAFPGVHQDAGDADAALRLKQIAAGGGGIRSLRPASDLASIQSDMQDNAPGLVGADQATPSVSSGSGEESSSRYQGTTESETDGATLAQGDESDGNTAPNRPAVSQSPQDRAHGQVPANSGMNGAPVDPRNGTVAARTPPVEAAASGNTQPELGDGVAAYPAQTAEEGTPSLEAPPSRMNPAFQPAAEPLDISDHRIADSSPPNAPDGLPTNPTPTTDIGNGYNSTPSRTNPSAPSSPGVSNSPLGDAASGSPAITDPIIDTGPFVAINDDQPFPLDGFYSPGHSPGVSDLSSFTLSDVGNLLIEIRGNQPGIDFDLMRVSGLANLDAGNIFFAFIDSNNYLPQLDDTFEFLLADQIQIDNTGNVNWYFGFFQNPDHGARSFPGDISKYGLLGSDSGWFTDGGLLDMDQNAGSPQSLTLRIAQQTERVNGLPGGGEPSDTFSPEPLPTPTPLLLMASIMLGLGLARVVRR